MANGFNNVPPVYSQVADNIVGGNIGGIISTRPSAKYMSGARCILKVNGRVVGFAFGVSWDISTSYTEIDSIDNIVPDELAPRRIQVSGNISALHIPGQSAGVDLWQADPLSFLFHQYIVIEVRDSATNQLLFYTNKAVITTRREEIRIDDLASVSLSFMAIGFRDEKVPSTPENFDKLKKEVTTGDLPTEQRQVQSPTSNLITTALDALGE